MSPVQAHNDFLVSSSAMQRPLVTRLRHLLDVASQCYNYCTDNVGRHAKGRARWLKNVLDLLQDDNAFDDVLFVPRDLAAQHVALHMAHAYNGVANDSWVPIHDTGRNIGRPLQFGYYLQDLSTHLNATQQQQITLWSMFSPELGGLQRPTSKTTDDLLRRQWWPYEFAFR